MLQELQQYIDQDFGQITEAIRLHAKSSPTKTAIRVVDAHSITYDELDNLLDKVAATLQEHGLQRGDRIAICADTSVEYVATYLGALRAGIVVVPLAPSSTEDTLVSMISDAQPKLIFADQAAAEKIPCDVIILTAWYTWYAWLSKNKPAAIEITADSDFAIIYSSGTTGQPKGIVQQHGMRWALAKRGLQFEYDENTVSLISTPLYSNTTSIVFFSTLLFGGSLILMPKFSAERYLSVAEFYKVTHTMLVPVQYQRILAEPSFKTRNLSSFKYKFCTSAPFSAKIKAEILASWPGGLVEFYGMTEGGGTCILEAHKHPTKLHTVGKPAPTHDIRIINDDGQELPAGQVGEVVGSSRIMMKDYLNKPEQTAVAEWFDSAGKRFIRTGDIGRFDEDGFVILLDRKKDIIISGGFNIYPSDLEAVLRTHPAVADVAVVGVPSEVWGETPVAYVVGQVDPEELKTWINSHVGKTQRVADVVLVNELPRSQIGKVLKRELRDRYCQAET